MNWVIIINNSNYTFTSLFFFKVTLNIFYQFHGFNVNAYIYKWTIHRIAVAIQIFSSQESFHVPN
mgnify:CR=1 FL=1